MSTNEIVKLKGIKDGVMVIVSEGEFDEILEQTTEKIGEVTDFFTEGGGRVVFSGANIDSVNKIKLEQEICKILSDEVSIEYEESEDAYYEKMIPPAEKSKFHHGTLRSGQTIKSLGNLVVVGDVNPGAELIAVGNIVVMGVLRGTVHAGCDGDREATVSAARMAPTQIRIADIITRPPDGETTTEWLPEIAYIHEGNIYIDGYLSKKIQ